MEQRPDRVVGVDAADPLDRRLRHWLAIGHDREGLERRRRQPDRVRADVAPDQGPGLGRRDQLDPLLGRDEPDAAAAQRHLEVAEALVDGRPVDARDGRDLAAGQRPLGDEQQGLELGLGQLARDVGVRRPTRRRVQVGVGRLGRRPTARGPS